jgi:hypothetical protein
MDASARAAPVAVLIAVLTPLVDQYAGIVIAAIAGGLYPLAAARTATRWEGAKLLFRFTLTAVVLAGSAAWALGFWASVPAHVATPTGAFFLALIGDRWGDIRAAVVGRVLSLIGGGQ